MHPIIPCFQRLFTSDDRGRGDSPTHITQTEYGIQAWEDHLSGASPLYLSPVTTQQQVSWGLLRLDPTEISPPNTYPLREAQPYPCVPIQGQGCMELWMFWQNPIPAVAARQALQGLKQNMKASCGRIYPELDTILAARGDMSAPIRIPYSGGVDNVALKGPSSPVRLQSFELWVQAYVQDKDAVLPKPIYAHTTDPITGEEGWPKSITKLNTDPATWFVSIHGSDIRIECSTKNLLNPLHYQRVIMDRTGLYIRKARTGEWQQVINRAMKSCITIDVEYSDRDAYLRHILMEWIKGPELGSFPMGLYQGRPCRLEDKIYFKMRDFYGHANKIRPKSYNRNECITIAMQAGFEVDRVKTPTGAVTCMVKQLPS